MRAEVVQLLAGAVAICTCTSVNLIVYETRDSERYTKRYKMSPTRGCEAAVSGAMVNGRHWLRVPGVVQPD